MALTPDPVGKFPTRRSDVVGWGERSPLRWSGARAMRNWMRREIEHDSACAHNAAADV